MGNRQSTSLASDDTRRWHTAPKWGTSRRKKPKALPSNAESSRVLFLLYLIHRTWNVVVDHVDSKSGRWRGSHTVPASEVERFDSISLCADSDKGSTYSYCSCSYCRLRDYPLDCDSVLALEGMASTASWSDEQVSKEKQRPPIYNPEDYAISLKKWGKKASNGHPNLYATLLEPTQDAQKARTLPQGSKDFRNGANMSMGEEMSLRQFGTASELLTKLRADLRLAFPSFVQEFSCEPLDGVTLLLELLRNVQLSQSGEGTARAPPQVQRRALLDELACLQCIWCCCSRYPECVRRLVASSCGLYTLTVCIMSTVNKSRILALQLLTKACNPPANGHSTISEALSTLRLRYGEPVRFRFLVGMLQSAAGTGELQAAGLSFINALLFSAPTPQRKLYIQAELEQAGFDIVTLKKMMSRFPNSNEQVNKEIESYEQQLIDIDHLSERANEAQKEKNDLKNKLELLEKRIKILQEEKGILISLEKCLKEKCCELQEEVTSLRSEHGNSNRKKFASKKKTNRDECSPPEDEGISSSERSLSPEGDPQREPMIYEVYNVKNETFDMLRNKRTHQKHEANKMAADFKRKTSDDEDETTIDEVIQELRNIVNDAESEQYKEKTNDDKSSRFNQTSEINVSIRAMESRHRDLEKEDSITSTKHSIHITGSTEYLNDTSEEAEECEIIPTKILPHPPRKAKSLVHLFVPPVDQGLLYNKEPDLYDDPYYSSDEGSDSLLSASKYSNQLLNKPSMTSFDFHECRAKFNGSDNKLKEKSTSRKSRTRSKDDVHRKMSLKRSESFQTSERGSYKDKFQQREQIDNMFYQETHSPMFGAIVSTPIQRSDSRSSRKSSEAPNLADTKKITKSLDRIDEGLNSMVDIVMMSEIKKPDWPYESRKTKSSSRTNSDVGKETPLIPINRSNSRKNMTYGMQKFETRSSNKSREDASYGKSESHKFFMSPKLSNGSYENHSLGSYNTSFMMKRGNLNAGFYSGQTFLRDAPASMTSLVMTGTHSHADIKRALSPIGPKSLSSHSFGVAKVTDMPSGLY